MVLFGSHARGEATANSDLDFLVVEAEEDDGNEAVRLMRVLRDLRVAADVIVVSERYAENGARCGEAWFTPPSLRAVCSWADGQRPCLGARARRASAG